MSAGGVGGWWMASDGRWYPPEQHPDHRAEAPGEAPPPTPPAAQPPTPPPTRSSPTARASAEGQFAARPSPTLPSAAVSAYYAGSSDPRYRKGRRSGSVVPFVVVVVLVVLGTVGAMAYFTFSGNKSVAPLPHVALPKLPTVSSPTPASTTPTSSTGQAPLSAGFAPGAGNPGVASTTFGGTTGSSAPAASSPAPASSSPSPAPASGGGCTKDPNGSCISAGQPCSSAWAGESETGDGGNFVCEEKKAISNGGGALPLGYFWEAT